MSEPRKKISTKPNGKTITSLPLSSRPKLSAIGSWTFAVTIANRGWQRHEFQGIQPLWGANPPLFDALCKSRQKCGRKFLHWNFFKVRNTKQNVDAKSLCSWGMWWSQFLLVAILVDPRFRIFITLINSATISGYISSSTCALNQENFSKKSFHQKKLGMDVFFHFFPLNAQNAWLRHGAFIAQQSVAIQIMVSNSVTCEALTFNTSLRGSLDAKTLENERVRRRECRTKEQEPFWSRIQNVKRQKFSEYVLLAWSSSLTH